MGSNSEHSCVSLIYRGRGNPEEDFIGLRLPADSVYRILNLFIHNYFCVLLFLYVSIYTDQKYGKN